MPGSMVMKVVVFVLLVLIAIWVLMAGILPRIFPGLEATDYQLQMNTFNDLYTECDLWSKGAMLRSFYSENIIYYAQRHEDKTNMPDGWDFCEGYLQGTNTGDNEERCRAACVNLINVGQKCDSDPSEYTAFTGLWFEDISIGFGAGVKKTHVDGGIAQNTPGGVPAPGALNGATVNSEIAKTHCKYYMIPVIYKRLTRPPAEGGPLWTLQEEEASELFCTKGVWLREVSDIQLLDLTGECVCNVNTNTGVKTPCGANQCCVKDPAHSAASINAQYICIDPGHSAADKCLHSCPLNDKLTGLQGPDKECQCGTGSTRDVCSENQYCCVVGGGGTLEGAEYACGKDPC